MNTFHQDVWKMESEWDRGTARYERWLDQVSKGSGIKNLDGDSEVDGYSLDELYGVYLTLAPPFEAIAYIKRNRAKLGLPAAGEPKHMSA